MLVTLLHAIFPRSEMIVPVATRPWEIVAPGVAVAAEEIAAAETDGCAAAGRGAGNAGEQGEEGEGGLHPLAGDGFAGEGTYIGKSS